MKKLANFIKKIEDPIEIEWKSTFGNIRWLVLIFIMLHYHLFNKHPMLQFDIISLGEFLYVIYIVLIIAFSWRAKNIFLFQLTKILFDFLFITLFEYVSLSLFNSQSWIFVLYIHPLISCSLWFKNYFALGYVTVISIIYTFLNYPGLDLNNLNNILANSKGRLGQIIFIYYLVAMGVLFFKKRIQTSYARIEDIVNLRTVELKREKEITESLLKSSFDGIIRIGEDGHVTEANKQAREILGYDEEPIGSKVNKYYANGEAQRVMTLLRKSNNGTIKNIKSYFLTKDGEELPVMLSAAFLYDKNLNFKDEIAKGKKFSSIGLFRDISPEEAMEDISKKDIKNEKMLLTEIVRIIAHKLKAETCSILVFNEITERLEVISEFGTPKELKKRKQGEHYKINQGFTGKVFFNKKVMNISNVDGQNKPKSMGIKWHYAQNFANYSRYQDFRHYLGMPLLINNEVYGVIRVLNKFISNNELDTNGFTIKDETLLEGLTGRVSTLLERVRNNSRFEAISKFGVELNEQFDLPINELLDKIAERVVRGMKFRACYLRLIDENGTHLVIKAGYGFKKDYRDKKKYYLEIGQGISGYVVKTGEKIIVNDLTKKDFPFLDRILKERLNSLISLPLKFGGKVFGVINCGTRFPHNYTEQEIQILESFAAYAAIAIQNANFYDKLQRITQTYPRISELSMNIEEVSNKIATIAADVLETDILVFYRYVEKRKQIIWPPIFTGAMRHPQHMHREVQPTHAPLLIIKRGKSHYAPFSQKDSVMKLKAIDAIPPFPIREGIVSSAGVLLKVSKETVGIMFVNYRTNHKFGKDEQRLIENFASYIAIALQNVTHFREKKIADTLKTVGEVSQRFTHKMKSDIGGIRLLIDSILRKCDRDDKNFYPLNESRNGLDELERNINQILQLSSIKDQKNEKVSINNIINEFKSEILSTLKIHHIKLVLDVKDEKSMLYIDPKQLKIVFSNLAENSVVYMKNGGDIEISIYKKRNTLFIEWSDTGTGIFSGLIDKIFEIGYTTRADGFGLGLFHTRAIIEECGGNISVDPNYKKGAKFVIRLPLTI